MSNLRSQIIKPFLDDIFREKNDEVLYDHPWEIKATRLEVLLRKDEDSFYQVGVNRLTREEAIKREVGKMIDNPEEKIRQLLLMYQTYEGSEWEKSDIENFHEINRF